MASARISAVAPWAMRARRLLAASGATPAGSGASRTLAPMIPIRPADRKASSASSTAPRPACMVLVRRATAATGTARSPAPSGPSAWMRTCHDPVAISHSLPRKRRASSGARSATSATGGDLAAGPRIGTGTSVTWRRSARGASTSMAATPGITSGGRIVTSRRYGPASPSWKTSGLLTCAFAAAGAAISATAPTTSAAARV
jgi:hypothetical protein